MRWQVHDLGHVARHRGEPLESAVGQRRDAHLERQVRDDGHQVRVAGPLPVAVDGALDMRRAADHRSDRVRDCAAGVVLGVDADADVVTEVGRDLADDALDVMGQRPAVGVTQHQRLGTVRRRGLEHRERVLRVRGVAVEEVLRVEEDPTVRPDQEVDRLPHHRNALVEGGAQRLDDVEVPGLADDADRLGAGLDQRPQRRVVVDAPERAPGRAERQQRRRLELQLGAGPAEELLVLRVGLRVAALDPVDAEPVELLGDAQLVLDRQRDPLELRAVTQRRVEDLDRVRYRCPAHATSSTQAALTGCTFGSGLMRPAPPRSCTGRPGRGRPSRTPGRSRW